MADQRKLKPEERWSRVSSTAGVRCDNEARLEQGTVLWSDTAGGGRTLLAGLPAGHNFSSHYPNQQYLDQITPAEAHDAIADQLTQYSRVGEAAQQRLLAAVRSVGVPHCTARWDCPQCVQRQRLLTVCWENSQGGEQSQRPWDPPQAALRKGGLWSRSAQEIASFRKSSLPEPELSPGHGGDTHPSAVSTPLYAASVSIQGAPTGRVHRVPQEGDGTRPLPAEATRLLSAGVSFVLEGSRLWPSAQDKWASAAFLKRELQVCRLWLGPTPSPHLPPFLSPLALLHCSEPRPNPRGCRQPIVPSSPLH